MITREFDVIIRLPQNGTQDTDIVLTQHDKDVYKLNIRVFDGVNEIHYSEVESATITFAKSDGKVVQGDMQIEADQLTYVLGTNEIAAPGKLLASIQLLGANERLTTARFLFRVEKDLIAEDAVKSTSEFAILQRLKEELEAIDVVDLTNQFNAHKADIAPHPDAQTLVASRDIIHGDMHNIFTFNATSTGIGNIDAGKQLKIKLKMGSYRSTNIFDVKYVAGSDAQEDYARHRYTHKVIGFYLNNAQSITRLDESVIFSTSDGADVVVESVGANHEVFLIIKNTAQIVNRWSVTVDITTNRGKIEVVSVTLEDIPA